MNEIKQYKKWLTDNINKFNYKPIITEEKPDKIFIRFEGIIDSIYCYLCENWIDIWYKHSEEGVDLLCEIDMPTVEITDEKLYYCSTCKDPEKTYYKTIEELYNDHTFKLLLEWVNDIEPGDYIRVMDIKDKFFCAELKNRKRDWTWEGVEPQIIPLAK